MNTERTDGPAAIGRLAGERDLAPEERLMIEVLVCACTDLRLSARGPAADALRAAAQQWIAADDETWPMSFVPICRHFGVDPRALRERLLRHDGDRRGVMLPQAA
jgi:hypothetical protein